MLVLHTSDWHLGRALHRFDLLAAQAAFVDHLVEVVRAEHVDLVVVSGDVHDRAIPPVAAMRLFDEALSRVRDAGAHVVVISGNHDAGARLGDKAGLLDPRVRIRTDVSAIAIPVTVEDSHGPVHVYALPYLEPAAVAAILPAAPGPDTDDGTHLDGTAPAGSTAPSHAATLGQAMRAVHADRARRGGRSIVCAHAWVSGGQVSESERDIGVGGLAAVPAKLFNGITYTALGHLHRPQALDEGLRYSGSPLPYSFSEATDVKSSLLVDIDANGLSGLEEIPVPVYRNLARLRGRLAELMTGTVHERHTADFVSVVLTDPVRPMDAMATLQRRFPFALTLSHEPATDASVDELTYGRRIHGRSDLAVAEAFVTHVRAEPSEREQSLLQAALDDARRAEEAA
ncbi:exonuclease SbcCD subunit D [Protofrankia symbiont of Coriaria ruscifolia]|uniref:exonuclease SbcCD subunit D n=1 Tax=Protofrankia symbiont of Coriaria ruscifolia TaxID=1306542 RepID=UPI00104171B6|nr:exonuclease SbcCD subunit D [Protofrankia symbiont of Coriaria ruscifolia]